MYVKSLVYINIRHLIIDLNTPTQTHTTPFMYAKVCVLAMNSHLLIS